VQPLTLPPIFCIKFSSDTRSIWTTRSRASLVRCDSNGFESVACVSRVFFVVSRAAPSDCTLADACAASCHNFEHAHTHARARTHARTHTRTHTHTHKHTHSLTGNHNSFEREFYDMMRSCFLKFVTLVFALVFIPVFTPVFKPVFTPVFALVFTLVLTPKFTTDIRLQSLSPHPFSFHPLQSSQPLFGSNSSPDTPFSSASARWTAHLSRTTIHKRFSAFNTYRCL